MNFNKELVAATSKKVVAFTKRHIPEILTGLSCIGVVATAVVTAKNTPKALILLEAAQMEKGDEPLTFGEKAKATWKVWVPTAACVAGTMACSIGSNAKSLKEKAALLSAYSLAQDAAKTYQEKVVDAIGERKERDIRDKANQKYLSNDKLRETDKGLNVIQTGMGDNLMYDKFSGRYFRSSRESLDRVMYDVQRELDTYNFISINEIYDKMELPRIECGELLGFSHWENGNNNFEFRYTYNDPAALPEVGDAAIVVEFLGIPSANFRKSI